MSVVGMGEGVERGGAAGTIGNPCAVVHSYFDEGRTLSVRSTICPEWHTAQKVTPGAEFIAGRGREFQLGCHAVAQSVFKEMQVSILAPNSPDGFWQRGQLSCL